MRTERGNKRIVSKTEYVGIMSGRILGYTVAMFFFSVGMGGALLSGIVSCALFGALISESGHLGLIPIGLVITIAVFFLCIGLVVMGWTGIKNIGEEEIVPLTRQTALDIPVQDSLVRASSAEAIAAETILLRPAHAQTETESDELLRPHLQD